MTRLRTLGPLALVVAVLLLWWLSGPARTPSVSSPGGVRSVEILDWELVGVYEHDPAAFTQGLLWNDGKLYESLGNYGRSALRAWDLESGLIEAEIALPPEHFGEGLALVDDELIQLTWREGTVHRWSLESLEPRGEWRIEGEGWGLTFDGESFLQTDGTARLVWRDRETFAPTRELTVYRGAVAQAGLNELEWIDGALFANVWGEDVIVRIDPETGKVSGILHLEGLLSEDQRAKTDVLNGIAYRAETGTLLVTGKYWPQVFEIELRD